MIRLIALLIVSMQLWGADGPRIIYSREFPGSNPEYVRIVVERDGAAVYRATVDDPDEEPVEFRFRAREADELFQLAGKLNYFRKPLEANLKVANMGLKTFRYEDGAQANEQQFNFSKNADARVLADWFSRTVETIQHRLNLERVIRYEKLGVNEVLLELQVTMEKNRLVAGDQFLPMLDLVAADSTMLNMARSRAANLAAAIRQSAGEAE